MRIIIVHLDCPYICPRYPVAPWQLRRRGPRTLLFSCLTSTPRRQPPDERTPRRNAQGTWDARDRQAGTWCNGMRIEAEAGGRRGRTDREFSPGQQLFQLRMLSGTAGRRGMERWIPVTAKAHSARSGCRLRPEKWRRPATQNIQLQGLGKLTLHARRVRNWTSAPRRSCYRDDLSRCTTMTYRLPKWHRALWRQAPRATRTSETSSGGTKS